MHFPISAVPIKCKTNNEKLRWHNLRLEHCVTNRKKRGLATLLICAWQRHMLSTLLAQLANLVVWSHWILSEEENQPTVLLIGLKRSTNDTFETKSKNLSLEFSTPQWLQYVQGENTVWDTMKWMSAFTWWLDKEGAGFMSYTTVLQAAFHLDFSDSGKYNWPHFWVEMIAMIDGWPGVRISQMELIN